jgi:alcohol dehydrogenase class IV
MAEAIFAFPTTIHLGPGVRGQLPDVLAQAEVRRPLVVTDSGVAALGCFELLTHALRATGAFEAAVFSELHGNPREAHVRAGVEAFHAHAADAVVCVGGGAATDVGKAVALMAVHAGSILDYAEDAAHPRKTSAPLPFVAALPTTAGTGSEVGRSSVISEDDSGRKRVVFQPALLPKVVLADPELLVDLPPHLTAATGMDAVCHLVEAYCATGYHPMCDGIAAEGLALAAGSLARSVEEPKDITARSSMLMASMMGAVAFQKGLGVTHACAHALGAVLDVHHGLANGVLLPHALRFNVEAAGERLRRLAVLLELDDATADGFVGWVDGLRERVGIPRGLSALGASEGHLDALADIAATDGCLLTNPRPASRDELRRLLGAAL